MICAFGDDLLSLANATKQNYLSFPLWTWLVQDENLTHEITAIDRHCILEYRSDVTQTHLFGRISLTVDLVFLYVFKKNITVSFIQQTTPF